MKCQCSENCGASIVFLPEGDLVNVEVNFGFQMVNILIKRKDLEVALNGD